MKLFNFGTSKISTFFFIHREIITLVDAIFTGFRSGENRFVQPDAYLFARPYGLLIDRYIELKNDKEVNDYIKEKQIEIHFIDNIDSFTDHYNATINFWNEKRDLLLTEKKQIEAYMSGDSGVEKEVLAVSGVLEKLLPEYQKEKNEFLDRTYPMTYRWGNFTLDLPTATLQVGSLPPIEIQPNIREFKLLRLLIEHVGTVVDYTTLGECLELNAYHANSKNNDVARDVQAVKRDLGAKLKEFDVNAKEIETLLNSIQPKIGLGYKLLEASASKTR